MKKVLSLMVALFMVFTLTGCSNEGEDTPVDPAPVEEEETDRPFTESEGTIRYITIEGDKISLPETVGEYIKALEKYGRVEFGDTGKTLDELPKMEPYELSPLTEIVKVYVSDDQYHEFGLHYYNPDDKEISVEDAKVGRITLTYDVYSDSDTAAKGPELQQIDSIVLVTANGELPIDNVTDAQDLLDTIGGPEQNTNGYYRYTDSLGFRYRFETANQKGRFTSVQIDYPQ